MFIVADSGSTKSDWIVVDPKGRKELRQTVGLHPLTHESQYIATAVAALFEEQSLKDKVTDIFYYGSGCFDEATCSTVKRGLQEVFPTAQININHDLLAAARATCLTEPGIACILGTGSNSALYDGINIIDNVPSLGYLLGDEGSGTYVSRLLIRKYFYRELDETLSQAFAKYVPGGKSELLGAMYHHEAPNTYLASFTRFLVTYQQHPQVKEIVKENFIDFLDRHVLKYENVRSLPIHFVGSIAFLFSDVLQLALAERGLKMGRLVQKPIEELVKYHQSLVVNE